MSIVTKGYGKGQIVTQGYGFKSLFADIFKETVRFILFINKKVKIGLER